MREIRPYGSVRGARRKARPYRDRERFSTLRAKEAKTAARSAIDFFSL